MVFFSRFGKALKKNTIFLKISGIVILVFIITMSFVFASYSENTSASLASNLIRLHVVANSDSPEDQALKRKVRDEVLKYMNDILKESKDIEQTKFIISSNIKQIQKIALTTISKENKEYPVAVSLGVFPFPTKMYGDIVLPSGNYQALKIVIGEGNGANWWCVLFPPLCFVDATHGTIPESVKEDLKNSLTEEEYKIVTSSDSDEIPVKVKFKVIEVLNESKIKLSEVISKIRKL